MKATFQYRRRWFCHSRFLQIAAPVDLFDWHCLRMIAHAIVQHQAPLRQVLFVSHAGRRDSRPNLIVILSTKARWYDSCALRLNHNVT